MKIPTAKDLQAKIALVEGAKASAAMQAHAAAEEEKKAFLDRPSKPPALTADQVPGGSSVGAGCTCDFLTFGEWETAITPGRHHHHGDGSAVVTQAPWIAGSLATQLPNTQSASFSGGMWGQAQNGNSAIRNVTGSFGMTYNWGQGSGAWNANFDNRTYIGNVNGTGGVSFGGSNIPATTGNNTMAVNGSFFTGPGAGGAVVGVGGQFSAGGPGNSYLASGVFGGTKH